jgi:hypothetical protein
LHKFDLFVEYELCERKSSSDKQTENGKFQKMCGGGGAFFETLVATLFDATAPRRPESDHPQTKEY